MSASPMLRLASAIMLLGAASLAFAECNPPRPPVGSGGQWFSQYRAWCARCNGTPSENASPARCTPGPNWGRGGGGGAGGAELGRQLGGVLGEALRQGLFGDPQQEAERQRVLAAQEQERQRVLAERAREDQRRYERLRASLLGFNESRQLSLMGEGSSTGRPQLMLGEDAERSLRNPALAQFERAAAWSTLAGRASSPEDAVDFANAAFKSLLGANVDLPPPPPDVRGAPVGPWLTEVEALKTSYLEQHGRATGAARALIEAEQRRAMFMSLESRATDFVIHWYEGVRKPPRGEPELDEQRARQAATEASQYRQDAEAEARRAREELLQQQYQANTMEQGLRAWLSSFATNRKPDSHFYMGFEDGSRCLSQNAGPRCDKAGASPADYQNCLASYRLGYTAGERIKRTLLQQAHRQGELDRQSASTRNYDQLDDYAKGPCRAEYIMSYNNGRFGAGLSPVGR